MLSPTAATPRSSPPGLAGGVATGAAKPPVAAGFASLLALEAPVAGDADLALAHGTGKPAQPASGRFAGKTLPPALPETAIPVLAIGGETGTPAPAASDAENEDSELGEGKAPIVIEPMIASPFASSPEPAIVPAAPPSTASVSIEIAPAPPAPPARKASAAATNLVAIPATLPRVAAPEAIPPRVLPTLADPAANQNVAADPVPAIGAIAAAPATGCSRPPAGPGPQDQTTAAAPETASAPPSLVAAVASVAALRAAPLARLAIRIEMTGRPDEPAPLPAAVSPATALATAAPASPSSSAPAAAPLAATVMANDRSAPATPPASIEATAGADLQPLLALRDPLAMPADPAMAAPRTAPAAPAAPHDFAALIDRLVEAREAAAPQIVRAAMVHADFGTVTLTFQHGEGPLAVRMASTDPAFAPAVQAAAATSTDGGSGSAQREGSQQQSQQGQASLSGQSQPQHGSQREGGREPASRGNPASRSEPPSPNASDAGTPADSGIYA